MALWGAPGCPGSGRMVFVCLPQGTDPLLYPPHPECWRGSHSSAKPSPVELSPRCFSSSSCWILASQERVSWQEPCPQSLSQSAQHPESPPDWETPQSLGQRGEQGLMCWWLLRQHTSRGQLPLLACPTAWGSRGRRGGRAATACALRLQLCAAAGER